MLPSPWYHSWQQKSDQRTTKDGSNYVRLCIIVTEKISFPRKWCSVGGTNFEILYRKVWSTLEFLRRWSLLKIKRTWTLISTLWWNFRISSILRQLWNSIFWTRIEVRLKTWYVYQKQSDSKFGSYWNDYWLPVAKFVSIGLKIDQPSFFWNWTILMGLVKEFKFNRFLIRKSVILYWSHQNYQFGRKNWFYHEESFLLL